MNKTCPDCGGKQLEYKDTTDDGSYKPYCSTCKGKRTVPIKDPESIIEELEDICKDNEYILELLAELKNGGLNE